MAIQIPFNFKPFATLIQTTSYTVPSGFYSSVTFSIASSTVNNGSINGTQFSLAEPVTVWFKSGDIVAPLNGTRLIINEYREIN